MLLECSNASWCMKTSDSSALMYRNVRFNDSNAAINGQEWIINDSNAPVMFIMSNYFEHTCTEEIFGSKMPIMVRSYWFELSYDAQKDLFRRFRSVCDAQEWTDSNSEVKDKNEWFECTYSVQTHLWCPKLHTIYTILCNTTCIEFKVYILLVHSVLSELVQNDLR